MVKILCAYTQAWVSHAGSQIYIVVRYAHDYVNHRKVKSFKNCVVTV